MKKTNFNAGNKKPDIEINKPGDGKFWLQPNFSFWTYILFMVLSFYLWQGYFEPRVVDMFFEHLDEVTAIQDQYREQVA